MGEWQPIETAPKDGKPVLLVGRHGGMAVAWWGDVNLWGRRQAWAYTDAHGEYNEHYEFDDFHGDPTHWMPLPDPPSTRSGDE